VDLALYSLDTTSRFQFGFSKPAGTVSGLSKLLQDIAVELLSDYQPLSGRGSGLRNDLSETRSTDVSTMRAVAEAAVRVVESSIKARRRRSLSRDEQLVSLAVIDFSLSGSAADSWVLRLAVTTAAGTTDTSFVIE